MRKVLAALVEVVCGLPLVGVGALGGFVLLQSQSLVYLLFPLLCVVAVVLGWWRGRMSELASWQLAVLLNLPPLLLVLWFLSERVWLLLALPLLGTAFAACGLAAARGERVAAGGRRWLVLLLPLLLLNLALALAIPWFVSSLIVSREVNESAPLFRLALLEGGAVTAQELRGRVVVLDFWAVWCGPCRREFPELERAYERFAGRPGVAFYAVDSPRGGDTPEQARRFLRANGYRFAAAYDHGEAVEKSLSVHGFPTLLVLDRTGRIRFRHVGFVGSEDLVAKLTRMIEKLLRESAS